METKLTLHMAICDDEPAILEQLQSAAREILEADYDLSITASTLPEGILEAGQPFQLALLDVQLAQGSGIDLARKLLRDDPECRIIFVSGYTGVVSTVYEVPHYCFVLKDQIAQQLPRFLHRAADEAAQAAGRELQIRRHRRTEYLKVSQIAFLERQKHLTVITMTTGETFDTKEKLQELMDRMASPSFCRCHVSYVVNLEQVAEIDGHNIKMTTGHQIPVSRTYEEDTWKAYSRYLRRGL